MKYPMLIAGLASLAVAGAAMAQEEKEFFGDGGAIPDNDPNGFRSEIFVEDFGEILSFKSIHILGFEHSWAGDLQIFLTHKDSGTTVTLLDRPGVPESQFGDSANFAGDYWWTDGGFVYDADVFDLEVTEMDLGPVEGFLRNFDGEDKFGTWSLLIVDNAAGDLGSISSWSFVVNNVPAPGALALLGIAGLLGSRRRR